APGAEVDDVVAMAFERWDVWRMYADPYYWDTHVADWVARYRNRRREPRVFEWPTNTHKKMALSIKAYIAAMREGALLLDEPDRAARLATKAWSYDGHPVFKNHLANARKKYINILDEDEQNLFVISKERPDSPLKIDAAMAGCLSWEAYRDALAAGIQASSRRSRRPVSIM